MTHLVFDRDFIAGEANRRLFGSFVEHLGRAVYTGLYEPGHPAACERGFRHDVLELVRELGATLVRYPGGNFVSGYNWEDGVGPVEKRPRRRELAWMATETNAFGTNEFITWCRLAGIEPMLAVNLGTRGPKEAGEFYEYCNHPGGTALSDLRAAHGHPEPHGIRLWCLGNEMDGPWQMGHCSAAEYGRRAREAAKLMRFPDLNRSSSSPPDCKFVACGSSGRGMPSFGRWELQMLEECCEHVHYVSLHTYYNAPLAEPTAALAQADQMGRFIDEVAAVCDAVAAVKRLDRKLMLSFDEWNVWNPHPSAERWAPAWTVAPPQLELVYNLLDALLVGGMGLSLLARAGRVKIACLAQLVNVLAPIMTEPRGRAWRQTIFWTFRDLARHGCGNVLRAAVKERETVCHPPLGKPDGPKIESPALQTQCVAAADGSLALFALNRSAEPRELKVEFRGEGNRPLAGKWSVLCDSDLASKNTADDPERVVPKMGGQATVENGFLEAILQPFSWNVLRLRPV